VHIILILDATLGPNMTFLDLLSLEISFGEKTVTHADTHTAYHTICEPQCNSKGCVIGYVIVIQNVNKEHRCAAGTANKRPK